MSISEYVQHRTTVDTVIALARNNHLDDADPAIAAADALEALGIIAPPRLHAANLTGLSATPEAQRYAALAALHDYAIELLELAARVAAYDADPATAYEAEHEVDTITAPLGVAGRDTLEQLRDEYDRLIAESLAPSRRAARDAPAYRVT